MFCPKCGSNLPEDSVFCPKCGYKLPVDNTTQQQVHYGSVTQTQQPAYSQSQFTDSNSYSTQAPMYSQYGQNNQNTKPKVNDKDFNKIIWRLVGGIVLLIYGLVTLSRYMKYYEWFGSYWSDEDYFYYMILPFAAVIISIWAIVSSITKYHKINH
jgi:uncharacterized membrane protein YvbJ